jgi:hypothetical protein
MAEIGDNAVQLLRDVFNKACDQAIAIVQANCVHEDDGLAPRLYAGFIPFHGDDKLRMERWCHKCSKVLEGYSEDEYYDKFLGTEEKRQARIKCLSERSWGLNPEFVNQPIMKGQPILVHLSGSALRVRFASLVRRIGETAPTNAERKAELERVLKELESYEKDGRKWYYLVGL